MGACMVPSVERQANISACRLTARPRPGKSYIRMAFFHREMEAMTWQTLTEVKIFSAVPAHAWDSTEAAMGQLGDLPQNLAMLPRSIIYDAISASPIEVAPAAATMAAVTRSLSPVEAAQVGLTWHIARQMLWKANDWAAYPDEEVASTSISTRLPTVGGQPAADPL